jgi:hypothetical protein
MHSIYSLRKSRAPPCPGIKSRQVSSGTVALHRLCLAPLLLLLATGALALQDLFAVLVELELGDDDLGGSEGDGDGLAVGLLADNCGMGEYRVADQGVGY